MAKFQKKVVPLNTIKANHENPRVISESKLKKLINSLLVFPKMLSLRPITVDGGFLFWVAICGRQPSTALHR